MATEIYRVSVEITPTNHKDSVVYKDFRVNNWADVQTLYVRLKGVAGITITSWELDHILIPADVLKECQKIRDQ